MFAWENGGHGPNSVDIKYLLDEQPTRLYEEHSFLQYRQRFINIHCLSHTCKLWPISVYRDLFDLFSRVSPSHRLLPLDRIIKMSYLIFLDKGNNMSNSAIDLTHIFLRFSHWDVYKVKVRNGRRIYCGLPKFLNPMGDNSSLDLDISPDSSPAESVNEKQQFDPCATATSTSVCLKDPDTHHHNLSTLQLLFAHIGYVNSIYYVLISRPFHSAALTLFLATTDAVRSIPDNISPCLCLINRHRQLFPRAFQQLSVTYKDLKFNTHG